MNADLRRRLTDPTAVFAFYEAELRQIEKAAELEADAIEANSK